MATPPEEQTDPKTQTTRPRIGIALGGGSARGYAHIGVLATLEEHGLAPDLIVGTSFGAVIGALYASGHSTEQLRRDAAAIRRRRLLSQVLDFGLHRASLFEGRRLEYFFDELTEGRHFEDLAIPLIVTATDVDSGESVRLESGSLSRALRASVGMPGIFCPVELDGRRLVDGGLAAPVPLETLDDYDVDIRLGVGVGLTAGDSPAIGVARRLLATGFGSRLHQAMSSSRQRNPVSSLGRALALTATSWCASEPLEDVLQLHTSPPISWLRFDRAEAAIAAGEEAMVGFLPKLRLAIARHGA